MKPSEKSPAVAALLAELVPQYLDQDLVQVVNGAVPECTNVCCVVWLLDVSCLSFCFSFCRCDGITVRIRGLFIIIVFLC